MNSTTPAYGYSQNPAYMPPGPAIFSGPPAVQYGGPDRFEGWNHMPPSDYFSTIQAKQGNVKPEVKPAVTSRGPVKSDVAPKQKEPPKPENPIKYEGLTLRKDSNPPFGESPSWSRVIETPMAASSAELSKIYTKKDKTSDLSHFFNNLRSGRQRVQLERLLADKNRDDISKNMQWMIVSIEEERGQRGKRASTTETKALHVIFKGEPKPPVKPTKEVPAFKKDQPQAPLHAVPAFQEQDPKKSHKDPGWNYNTGTSFSYTQPPRMSFTHEAERETSMQHPGYKPPSLPPIIMSNEGKPSPDGMNQPYQPAPATSRPPGSFARGPPPSGPYPPAPPPMYPSAGMNHAGSGRIYYSNPLPEKEVRKTSQPGAHQHPKPAPSNTFHDPFVGVIGESGHSGQARSNLKQPPANTPKPARMQPVPAPRKPSHAVAPSLDESSYSEEDSEEDSNDDDDSFHFSADSFDLSTPVSSPRSTGVTVPVVDGRSKRHSIDLMTELRNQKSAQQEASRAPKIVPRRQSQGAINNPLHKGTTKGTPKETSKKVEGARASSRHSLSDRSSAYDEALSSLRNSVQVVEMLEQEYIRKLEKLQLEETRQLDLKLDEIKQNGRGKERERDRDMDVGRDRDRSRRRSSEMNREKEKEKERDIEREKDRERERERERGRERERERERRREREREREREKERERLARRRQSRSRSRSSDRSSRRSRRRYFEVYDY